MRRAPLTATAIFLAACHDPTTLNEARHDVTSAWCAAYTCADPATAVQCEAVLGLPPWPDAWGETANECIWALWNLADECPDWRPLPAECEGLAP